MVQGAQGARCGARGTSLPQASPPSTELQARCAQRRWFPADTDTQHHEHFHLATIIDTLTESSVCCEIRDMVLVILVIVMIICNTAIILSLFSRCNDRQLVLTHYLFCKKGGMKSLSEYFHFISNMLQSSRSRRWHKIANVDRFLYLSIDRNWNKFVSI